MSAKKTRAAGSATELEAIDPSLLDIVDHVLTKGIVLTGDLVLGVADVDLVYLRLSAILCAADRVLGLESRGRRSRARRGASAAQRAALVASRLGPPKLERLREKKP
jgi:hypothetical protein